MTDLFRRGLVVGDTFHGQDMANATIEDTHFVSCHFKYCQLFGAKIRNSSFDDCSFSFCSMSQSTWDNVTAIDLSMVSTNLFEVVIQHSDMTFLLEKSNLSRSQIVNSIIYGELWHSSVFSSVFFETDLSDLVVNNSYLNFSIFKTCLFPNKASSVAMDSIRIEDCKMGNVDLKSCSMKGSIVADTDMSQCTVSEKHMDRARFMNSYMPAGLKSE